MQLMIIMRGIPGSGKSTLANKLINEIENLRIDSFGNGVSVKKYSTDDYWIVDGEYKFDITKLGESHAWNLERVKAAIQVYDCVIVDNTNIVWKDFKNYVKLAIEHGYNIMLAEPQTSWRHSIDECDTKNTHNVPKETIDRMFHKYQGNEEIMGYAKQMMERMGITVTIYEYDPSGLM